MKFSIFLQGFKGKVFPVYTHEGVLGSRGIAPLIPNLGSRCR